MTETSPTLSELAKALAEVQKLIGRASKSSENPHFRSRYADLAEVWDTWQQVGPQHGLAVVQSTDVDEGGVYLLTRLLHVSGEWIQSRYPLRPVKEDPQGYGSALTYARRYCLAAMVGIAPEDDDAEAASGRLTPPQQAEAPAPSPPAAKPSHAQPAAADGDGKASDKQRKYAYALARERGLSHDDAKAFAARVTGKPSSAEWTRADASAVIEALKALAPAEGEEASS